MAGTIDEEVKNLIDQAYAHCEKILKDNADKLQQLADFLLDKESMSGEQFEALMQGKQIMECSSTSMFDGFTQAEEEAPKPETDSETKSE